MEEKKRKVGRPKAKKLKVSIVEAEAKDFVEQHAWVMARLRSEALLRLATRLHGYLHGERGVGSPADAYALHREAIDLMLEVQAGMAIRTVRVAERREAEAAKNLKAQKTKPKAKR
jgi:hypothetical protein